MDLTAKNHTLQEEVTSLLGELHSTMQARDALEAKLKEMDTPAPADNSGQPTLLSTDVSLVT